MPGAAVQPHCSPRHAAGRRWPRPRTPRLLASRRVTTEPFCGACDPCRLTADGTLFTCLHARRGLDLCAPLRDGASPDELRGLIERAWRVRTDRGAEERLGLHGARTALAPATEMRTQPHLEMHTRGG